MTGEGRDAARHPLLVGRTPLRIEELVALAEGRVEAVLDPDSSYRSRLSAGAAAVERARESGQVIYGVSTGVGASLGNVIPDQLQQTLPLNLLRFHGCGTGRILETASYRLTVSATGPISGAESSGSSPLVSPRIHLLRTEAPCRTTRAP